MLESKDYTTQHYNNQTGAVWYTTLPVLRFNGGFGAVSLNFASAGKRDEVYSFIRQYEKMGIPVTPA
jgi:hypothetical protein